MPLFDLPIQSFGKGRLCSASMLEFVAKSTSILSRQPCFCNPSHTKFNEAAHYRLENGRFVSFVFEKNVTFFRRVPPHIQEHLQRAESLRARTLSLFLCLQNKFDLGLCSENHRPKNPLTFKNSLFTLRRSPIPKSELSTCTN